MDGHEKQDFLLKTEKVFENTFSMYLGKSKKNMTPYKTVLYVAVILCNIFSKTKWPLKSKFIC